MLVGRNTFLTANKVAHFKKYDILVAQFINIAIIVRSHSPEFPRIRRKEDRRFGAMTATPAVVAPHLLFPVF
jgi:hypothetical protein